MPLLSDYLHEPWIVLGFRAEHTSFGFGTVVRVGGNNVRDAGVHESVCIRFDNEPDGSERCFSVDIFLNLWGSWFRNVEVLRKSDTALQLIISSLRKNAVTPIRDYAFQLTPIDYELCFAWAGRSNMGTFSANSDSLVSAIGTYEAGRLMSARLAELAAINYFRALGMEVDDISVTQLKNNAHHQSWKDYDLLVNGRPVDVKNARKSFNNPDSYVEHCVPQFKRDRKTNAEVSILGVLSDYQTPAQFESGDIASRIILGEVSVTTIRKLYVWVKNRFKTLIDFSGLWRADYQPGWAFEYGAEFYGDRSQLTEDIGTLLSGWIDSGELAHIPGWLFALAPLNVVVSASLKPGSGIPLTNPDREILNDLLSLRDEVGYSRSSIYVYAMAYLMEAIALNKDGLNTIMALRGMLAINVTNNTSAYQPRPLGLADPLGYVASLLNSFQSIIEEIQLQNIRFSGFKLTHPSIIKGVTLEGQWITILAYCGGWQSMPIKVKCGNSPLHFGKNINCQICGHLVCDNCGFCAADCPLCHDRQMEIANKSPIKRKVITYYVGGYDDDDDR